MLNYSIGCDPEFCLVETMTGKICSAIGKLKGTKKKPLIAPNGAEVHCDNVLVEFASPVSESKKAWLNNCSTSLRLTEAMLPKGYSLAMDIASVSMDKSELIHPDAKEFGCSEDFNAYTLQANPIPECKDKTLRSCGGHIHIGHLALEGFEQKITMARVCDCLHGLISGVIDNSKGTSERRQLYGKAGCYRPTEYGLEYRTLSNYWMGDESTQELMYLLTRDALQIVVDEDHKNFFSIFTDFDIDVQKFIDEDEEGWIIWMEEYRAWLGEDTLALLDECLLEAAEIDYKVQVGHSVPDDIPIMAHS